LSEKWSKLERAGYAVLARLYELWPEKVAIKERQGL
jgi:putative protease